MTTLTLHGVELTASIAANALFLADVEPLALSDDDALSAIDRALTARDDDLTRCVAEVCGEIGDHPECAGPRWSRCVVRAFRLIGTEV
jgi:hypothetical protein